MFLAQWPSRSLALRGRRLRTEQATGLQCCLLSLPICNGRQTNSFLKLRSNPASRQRTYQADVGDTASRDYIRWQGSDTSGRPYRYRKLHLSEDRKSTRLNSSHQIISYAVFCLKKKKN